LAVVPSLLLVLAAGCSGSDTGAAPDGASNTPTAPSPAAVPVAPQAAPQPNVDPAELTTAREYTEMFYKGQLDLLHAEFSDEMREVVPMEQLNAMFEHAVTTYGEEIRVIAEDMQTRDDLRGFVRWARFDKTEEVIEIQWILKRNDEIAGFFIRPARRKVSSEADLALEP
jgi:hypothetical protein